MKQAPLGTATVTTPDPPQKPKGEMWDKLEAVKTTEQLNDLQAFAKRIGYSPEGQLMQAIAAKRPTLRKSSKE